MRWTLVACVLGLLPAAPAAAQDDGDRMKLARLAMEAQMKIGDLLHARGNHAAALEAYRKAVALYEEATRGEPEGVVLEEPVEVPEEEVAQEPIETDEMEDVPFEGEKVPEEEIVEEGLGGAAAVGRIRGLRRSAPASTENAVELALKWLASHQDQEGSWDGDEFMKHDPPADRCDGPGSKFHDVGLTGLALLAFLGAGHTDRGEKYADTVARGLRYIQATQGDDGLFGTRVTHSFIYDHAIATLALCEAYAMTRDPKYGKSAQAAVNFIGIARNPYMAWRYEPRGGENDTSVTVWCVAALKSAEAAGLRVDAAAFEGARLWIEKMTDPNFGKVGYNFVGGTSARYEGLQDRFPAEKTEAMTAAGIFVRILCGEDPRSSETIVKGADLCAAQPPLWNPDAGTIDMYYWYWGSLAMFQMGGQHWRKWNEAMKVAIVDHQHREGGGARTGSWDPIDAWSIEGGRVYATAMMALCLEVYYRYDRVFGGAR